MRFDVPISGPIEIKTIILDLNGTLSVGGRITESTKNKIEELKQTEVNIVLFTGNTRGDADELCNELGIEWRLAKDGEDKALLAKELGADTAASIGNGLIDNEMMKVVKLSILTLQAEGIHTATLSNSDIIVPTIDDALDLFLDENRLIATIRP